MDMRSTTAAISVGDAAMEGSPDALMEGAPPDLAESHVQSSADTPLRGATPTAPVTSAGVNASGGTASPDASVEGQYVPERDEINDSPSPELVGRATYELRCIGNRSSSGKNRFVDSKGSWTWTLQR